MSFTETQMGVIRWAEDRKILFNSTPEAQLLKTVEELGELVGAVLKKRPAQIEDGFGDVLVTLTIAAALLDVDLSVCYANAYQEIRHRKGTMSPAGVFVKQE